MSEVAAPASPYIGLIPYYEKDAQFFFGREEERDIIIANLMASRLTILYGASGVGKSSVLGAGVVHHLRRRAAASLASRTSPEFVVAVFSTWRDNPLPALMLRIEQCIAQAASHDKATRSPKLREAPTQVFSTYLRFAAERAGGELYVVLDQFEEYFLYHQNEDGEGTFAVEFPRAVNLSGLRVNFLLSIREDAMTQLDRFKGRIPGLFDNYLRIRHLGRAAAREAILKPVEQFNRLSEIAGRKVSIEPELVDAVLDQIRTGQVQLGESGRGEVATGAAPAEECIETPYLQLVMTRLWDEEMRSGSNILRLKTLADLGGAERIVHTHLDTVMSNLPRPEQEAAARVFHFMVTPSRTKIAHTLPDLAAYTEMSQEQLGPVLEKLAGPDIRILRPVPATSGKESERRFEIFHDVLATAVLDWRRRFVERQTQEQVRRREREAQEEERTAARTRFLRKAVIFMVAMLALVTSLLFYALQQRNLAESRNQELLVKQRDLAAAQITEKLRADTFAASIQVKSLALSPKEEDVAMALASSSASRQIVFRVRSTPLNYRDAAGRMIFRFELFPDESTVPGGLASLAFVTYKMSHPTFKNTLLPAGPDRNFTASYDGWGCLRQVIAVIEFKDPSKTANVASFDMCAALGVN